MSVRRPISDPNDSKALARDRIAKALDHIQQAQNHLDYAGQEISAVCFALPLGNLVMNLRTRVHDAWHKINLALERDERSPKPKFDLDELHKKDLS